MIVSKCKCGETLHEIALDDDGNLHLLNHDLEEEEALAAMGLETAECYNTYKRIHECSDDILCAAAVEGNIEMAHIAIASGADVDCGNSQPMRYAASYGRIEMIQWLLDKGANPYQGNGTGAPLSHAAMYGHTGAVALLLNLYHDQNLKDHLQKALDRAVHYGHASVVALLIKNGAKLKKRNDETVATAFKQGHCNVINVLLSAMQNTNNLED